MADEHPPQISVVTFWNNLGALVARLLSERAHAEITITLRDGHIHNTNVNRSYRPNAIPVPPRP